MKISTDQNFCRVFQLPLTYPSGFLFGGGKPVTFVLVDWFNPVYPEMLDKEVTHEQIEELYKKLRDFIKGKVYYDSRFRYLIITDYGDTMLV